MILSPEQSGQTKFGLQPFQNQPLPEQGWRLAAPKQRPVQASTPAATFSVLAFSGLDIGSPPSHTPATMINATPKQLRKAANIQEKIQSLQEQLGQLLGASAQPATRGPRKRRLSAQGLANIRAGVRKRLAAKAKTARHPKRKFSAAGRARLAALAKARWAKAKRASSVQAVRATRMKRPIRRMIASYVPCFSNFSMAWRVSKSSATS